MEPKQVYRFDSPKKEEWLAGIQYIKFWIIWYN